MEVAGSRSIAEVVSAARAMTGKPARASDQVETLGVPTKVSKSDDCDPVILRDMFFLKAQIVCLRILI